MRPASTFDWRRPLWRALLLLAATLVALQGLSAAVLAARGPLHAHVPASAGPVALVDFRRAALPSPLETRATTTAPPHRHDHGDAARHHHAADDGSVLDLDGDAARAAAEPAADEARVPPPAFLALTGRGLCVPFDATVATAARDGAPAWRSRSTAPPERPPRLG